MNIAQYVLFLASVSAICLAGNVSAWGDQLSLMKGQGSVQRNQNGQTSFRYVIPINAYKGILDAKQLPNQHRWLIGQFIGEKGICAKGYKVERPELVQGFYIYSGTCK